MNVFKNPLEIILQLVPRDSSNHESGFFGGT